MDGRVQDLLRLPQPAQPRHPALVMVTDRRGCAIRRCTELSRTHKHRLWSVHLSIFSAVPLSFAILFLINRDQLPNSPGCLFIIFEHCRGCKGHSVWEKLPIEVFGMDSLQTAFSFCSCDGLVLSWLQMRFAFLICTPCWLKRRHGSEIAERGKENEGTRIAGRPIVRRWSSSIFHESHAWTHKHGMWPGGDRPQV